MSMADVSLRLLVLKTHRLAAVREFYELLGVGFREERHGKGPLHFSSHLRDLGELVLEIYPLKEDETPDVSLRLGFAVLDANRIIQKNGSEWHFHPAETAGRSVRLSRGAS